LEGGFSENITLLQRRPVDGLAKTLALAYSLREERVTNALNEENETSEPPTPSSAISGKFKFSKEDIKSELSGTGFGFRRVSTAAYTQSTPPTNETGMRWGRGLFGNNNSSNPIINTTPKTPPPPEPTVEDTPSKFSPGAWGASLSAASRKLNKLRISQGQTSPVISPSSPKTAVHLDDRHTPTPTPSTLPAFSTFMESTASISARVSAAVRDSFDRRNEILSKVGGWVANTNELESGQSSLTDWEDVESPRRSTDSRANEDIKQLEGEIPKKEKEISPEEYIARIKKRLEKRESREGKGRSLEFGGPFGVGGV
jgi:hypothetical protein